MHASKVEIAFWRNICNVCRDLALLAELPDLARGFGVVDRCEDHIYVVEVGGNEFSVYVVDLALGDSIGYFRIESLAGRDDGYFGISVEDV